MWIRIHGSIPLTTGSGCGKLKVFSVHYENLDSYYFVTLFDFLTSENHVNVSSKSI
jgi:hypothetical protein